MVKSEVGFSAIQGEKMQAKIHGKTRAVKYIELSEKWLNRSKNGRGFYAIFMEGRDTFFVSIDLKTANDYYWGEYVPFAGGNIKVTCPGYLYISDNDYLQFAIKNVRSFKCLASTSKEKIFRERNYSRSRQKELLEDMRASIVDLEHIGDVDLWD